MLVRTKLEGVSTVNVARAKGQDVSTGKIGGMYVCMYVCMYE